MTIDGQELSNHIQGLKERVAEAVTGYLKENQLEPDKAGFVVAHATTVIAALYIQEHGGSKAQLYQACDAQWDFVKMIHDMKDTYDRMTPKERQIVINGTPEERDAVLAQVGPLDSAS